MAITDDVLNELLKDYQKPEDLLGQNGLLKQLQKRLLEKAMGAELTVHLGYGKHDPAGRNSLSGETIVEESWRFEIPFTSGAFSSPDSH